MSESESRPYLNLNGLVRKLTLSLATQWRCSTPKMTGLPNLAGLPRMMYRGLLWSQGRRMGERTSRDLQCSFLILSPSGPAENSGLRRIPLSVLSLVLPWVGGHIPGSITAWGNHCKLPSLGRLGPSLPASRPGSSYSYSCLPHPPTLAGNGPN